MGPGLMRGGLPAMVPARHSSTLGTGGLIEVKYLNRK
jgi:hypothetical protein